MKQRARAGAIDFLGTFPPPNHGMAIATESLVERLEALGVAVRRCDTAAPASEQPWKAKIRKILRTFGWSGRALLAPPPVALIGADAGWGLLLQCVPVAVMRLRRRNVFVFHHSVVFPRAETAGAQLFARIAGSKVIHVLQCERLIQEAEASFGARGITTLELSNGHVLGPMLQAFSSPRRTEREHGPCKVGHLSNLDVQKGFAVVGDAVLELRRRGHNVEYHLAGLPTDAQAEQELHRLRRVLGDDLRHHGFVEGAEKSRYFGDIDVFVHPSIYRNECYSIAVWEALAAGVPVVTMDAGCLTETSVGAAGVMVDQQSATHVADATELVLGTLIAQGCAARAVAEAEFERSIAQVRSLSVQIAKRTKRTTDPLRVRLR